MLSLEAINFGEGRDSNEEHERGEDGSKRAHNSAHPVVDEDVHLVDREVAEDGQRSEDRRQLENEVMAHPHGVPGAMIPRVHIHHGSDARPAPEVPRHDWHVCETPPDAAKQDGRGAKLGHFLRSVDSIMLVPRRGLRGPWLRYGRANNVVSALDEGCWSEQVELLLHLFLLIFKSNF